MRKKEIDAFVSFVKNDLNGDERGQAQTFCDRLFRAYGQKGIYEAQGKLEARIKIADQPYVLVRAVSTFVFSACAYCLADSSSVDT